MHDIYTAMAIADNTLSSAPSPELIQEHAALKRIHKRLLSRSHYPNLLPLDHKLALQAVEWELLTIEHELGW